ncbi:hypothetical protein MKX03_029796 [Papaver bracteatum]|nr:hypothetical protein MKX03_029796 [Papaver bracteatum]
MHLMIDKALSSEQDPSAKRNASLPTSIAFLNGEKKGKYIKIIISLLNAYLRMAATNSYCQLLQSQSDNNVKLIVLDRLNELKTSHREIMVDNTVKCLFHSCAIKFPEVASTVVHLLMDFLGDSNVASAIDVVVFVCQIIETNPKLRDAIINRLLDTFYQIRAARVCSHALWIMGEYLNEEGDGADTSKLSQQVNSIIVSSRRPAILADGTYATRSAASETAISPPTLVQGSLASPGNLRSLVLGLYTDDIIDFYDFYHLKSRKGMSPLELEDEVQDDLKRTTGEFTKDGDDVQLTRFSDPVYAETYVTIHHYDIVLDVMVINHNFLLCTPQNYTLAPESSKQIRDNIKVSSTETGVIFRNIVYETSNVMERAVVVLIDTHIGIMDYISPATHAGVAFRTIWAEFEWENKVIVMSIFATFLSLVPKTNFPCTTNSPSVTLLFFVDDSFIFTSGSVVQAIFFYNELRVYNISSSQLVNYPKSGIYFILAKNFKRSIVREFPRSMESLKLTPS